MKRTPHLVENDTGEDEEEHKHIEEGLRALHGSKGRRVPTALREHQVLDGRQDIHKDVGTEHGQCQEQQSRPAHGSRVAKSFSYFFSHCNRCVIYGNERHHDVAAEGTRHGIIVDSKT